MPDVTPSLESLAHALYDALHAAVGLPHCEFGELPPEFAAGWLAVAKTASDGATIAAKAVTDALAAQRDDALRRLAVQHEAMTQMRTGHAEALAAHVAENERLRAERDKLSRSCRLLGRVVSDQGRALYAAWIDAVRGDHAAAKETLAVNTEDVLELHTWDGTETGTEWYERTREDGDDD